MGVMAATNRAIPARTSLPQTFTGADTGHDGLRDRAGLEQTALLCLLPAYHRNGSIPIRDDDLSDSDIILLFPKPILYLYIYSGSSSSSPGPRAYVHMFPFCTDCLFDLLAGYITFVWKIRRIKLRQIRYTFLFRSFQCAKQIAYLLSTFQPFRFCLSKHNTTDHIKK